MRKPDSQHKPQTPGNEAETNRRHRAEERPQYSEDVFRLLVESVKDYAIFVLDRNGNISTWNPGAERIKGYTADEIIGKHFSVFYPPEVVAKGWPEHELEVAASEGRFEDEGWRVRKDGSRFWANVVITALRERDGSLRGFAKVTRDLSRRRRAEEVLRETEERYRLLVEGVKDYAIFLLDPTGHVVTWNAGAERINGYTATEIIGQHFSTFYPEEAIRKNWPTRELEMAAQAGQFEDENWRVRKDGSRFWSNVLITALRDSSGKLYGFSKVTRDITERRELEERLRALSRRLLRVQDQERRRIARELHESLSQELSAMKMMLESTLLQPSLDPTIKDGLEEALQLGDRVLQGVRSLSYLLHPPLLDDAGLVPALQWYVEGISKRSNIKVNLEILPPKFPRLASEVETSIFRIVQEALTNVYRHSGSKTADVVLEHTADRANIRIRDYGKGTLPDIQRKRSAAVGVGIGGMRERTRQCGGDLSISSCEPGTLIEAWFPIHPRTDPAAM
jgi:PAS domain S-box-containing protein